VGSVYVVWVLAVFISARIFGFAEVRVPATAAREVQTVAMLGPGVCGSEDHLTNAMEASDPRCCA
jgi:hypothetical protein